MPTYRVTGPDGHTYQVTAPEGATQDQVLARVRQNASPKGARGGAVSGADAVVRGAADMASLGLADKIAAAGNAILPLDRLSGRNVESVWDNGGDFTSAFRKNLSREQAIDRADQRENPNLRLAGQVVGGVVGPVPGRGLIAKAASKLPRGAQMARIVGESAAQSGAYGLGKGDSTSVGERLRNAGSDAALGAAGGALGAGLVRGGARLISPVVDKNVRTLAKAGVVMTPGQRGGRLARFVEQASESIPVIREPIKAAKARGVEQFNRAFINEAMAPIGTQLPKGVNSGRAAIEFAQQAEGEAFDKALAKINAPADDILAGELEAIAQRASDMPPDLASSFTYMMKNEIAPLLSGKQQIDGKTLQKVNRLLQSRISGLRKNDDGLKGILADNLDEVRQSVLSLAQRHSGEGASDFLKANEASARLQRVYDAASRPSSVEGMFTPSTAASAVARKGYGTNARNLARGEARMQSLADAAKAVLPDTLPNSGTADRAAWITGLGAVGSGGAAAINPALAAPGLGLLNYVPGLDAIMQKAALRGQDDGTKLLADEIRKRAYIGGMFGAPVALQVGN